MTTQTDTRCDQCNVILLPCETCKGSGRQEGPHLYFGVAECGTCEGAGKVPIAEMLLSVLHECAELLDDYSDVNDGDDGRPVANRAMSLLQVVEAAIAQAEGK